MVLYAVLAMSCRSLYSAQRQPHDMIDAICLRSTEMAGGVRHCLFPSYSIPEYGYHGNSIKAVRHKSCDYQIPTGIAL